jgi:hypothetical protein
MSTTESDFETLVADEYARFNRSAAWELRNIVRALNMLPFLNGPQEDARLIAVERIQAERRNARRLVVA